METYEKHSLKHAEWKPSWRRRSEAMLPVLLATCLALGPAAMVGYGSTLWWKNHPVTVKKTETVIREVAPKTAADDENIMAVARTLTTAGYTDLQASAVCGSLWAESHGQVDALEKGVSDGAPADRTNSAVREWAKTHAGGVGLMQWTGDRAAALLDWMDSNGKDWRSVDAQAEFLLVELKDPAQWTVDRNEWLQAADVESAASAIEDGFVRPADPDSSRVERSKAALAVYSSLQTGKAEARIADK